MEEHYVEVEEVISETEDAILIKLAETEHTVRSSEDAEEISIPKRVILSDSEVTEVGDSGTLVVSERFAKKRGWV